MRERQNHTDRQYHKVLAERLRAPGGLYNAGNVVAFTAGLVAQLRNASGQMSLLEALYQYAFGNPTASWLTLAIVTFIVSGEFYHKAWRDADVNKEILVQKADGLSAVAAVFLSFSLASSGDLWLAIFAGILLAGGKLGSAVLPTMNLTSNMHSFLDKLFRWAVVASRAPSLLILGLVIVRLHAEGVLVSQGFLPVTMLVCFLMWIAADFALMRSSSVPKLAQGQPNKESSYDAL